MSMLNKQSELFKKYILFNSLLNGYLYTISMTNSEGPDEMPPLFFGRKKLARHLKGVSYWESYRTRHYEILNFFIYNDFHKFRS